MILEQRFNSAQVVALTGITPRQLQWWDERGIVVPQREGRNRIYSFEDLTEIAILCQLRKKGFSLQRVRKVMRFLQRELGKRMVETIGASGQYHLLTDGKNIYLRDGAEQVIDVLKNSRQPLLGVCLSDAVRELRAEVRMTGGLRAGKRLPARVNAVSRTRQAKRKRA